MNKRAISVVSCFFLVIALQISASSLAQGDNAPLKVDYTLVKKVFSDDFNSKVKRYGNPDIIFEDVAPAVQVQTGKGVYTVGSEKKYAGNMLYYPNYNLFLPAGKDEYLHISFILDRFSDKLSGKKDLECSARFFLTPVTNLQKGQYEPFTASTTLSMLVVYEGKDKNLNLRLYEKTNQQKPGFGRLLYRGVCSANNLPMRFDLFVGQDSYIISFSKKVTTVAGNPIGKHGIYKILTTLPSPALRTGIRIVNHTAGIRAQMVVDNFAASIVKIKSIQGINLAEETAVKRFDVSSDKTWKLIWRDEFNGTKIDTQKWQILSEGPNNLGKGWPKGYRKKENIYLDGKGHLVIRFSRDKEGNLVVGGMKSRDSFLYGYFEARLKLTTQPGWWAAFWLYRKNAGANPFLNGLEIDIFEDFFKGRKIVQEALHVGVPSAYAKSFTKTTPVNNWDEFHVFGLKWTPLEYIFYIDGIEVLRWGKEQAVTTQPCQVWFSSNTGSAKRASWTGDYRDAKLPDYYVVDYVRVYKKDNGGKKKPRVIITSPTAVPRSVKEGDSVTIEASAEDTDGKIREVYLFDNGYLLEAKTAPPYRFKVTFNKDYY